jgi:hypothetical protein
MKSKLMIWMAVVAAAMMPCRAAENQDAAKADVVKAIAARQGEGTWIGKSKPHERHPREPLLPVGADEGPCRTLLRFDLADRMSTYAAIKSAVLTLKLADTQGEWKDQTFVLHAVRDWRWGAENATWASANDSGIFTLDTGEPIRTPWAKEGCDSYSRGVKLAEVKVSSADKGGEIRFEIKDAVILKRLRELAHHPDPKGDGGFLVMAPGLEGKPGHAARFASWGAAGDQRPSLALEVTGYATPRAVLRYALKEAGRVSVVICDAKGRLVRELRQGVERPAGKNEEGWDGKDEQGQVLPAGQYTWKLLRTSGLQAEYVMTLGTNPDVPWERWPGNHNPVNAVGADSSGIYFVGGACEGPPMIVKETADGKRLWSISNNGYSVCGGGKALSAMDGKLFMVGSDGKVHRLDAATGAREATIVGDKTQGLLFRDVAARGGRVLLSLADKNLVRWLDPANGKTLSEVQVAQPTGVAIEADGSGLVISEGRILRLPAGGGEPAVVVAADQLVEPWRMDVDPGTGDILVAESDRMVNWMRKEMKLQEQPPSAGSGKQVKRFAASGKLKRAYGDAGGRPEFGRYHPERGFCMVNDITAAPDGTFLVVDLAVPSRTVRYAADGKLLREWFGGFAYSSWAGADPADPSSVWMILPFGFLMRMEVDYAKKSWRPAATYKWDEVPGFGISTKLGMFIKHKNGKTLLCSNAYPGIVRVDEENGRLVPMSAMSFPNLDGGPGAGTPEVLAKMKADRKLTYQWADTNGNGQMDLDEVTYPPGIMFIGGNSYMDDTFTYYAWSPSRLNTGLVYRPQGFTANGAPIYDNAKQQFVAPMPDGMRGYSPAGVWRDDQGNMFAAFNGGKPSGIGFWSGRIGDNKVVKYDAEGKLQWVVGRHSLTGAAAPGEGRYFWQIIGVLHGCVAVTDVEDSLVHLWDTDGLWAGRLLESPVLNGLPSWVFQIKCENLGGSLYTEKDGSVLFFASNENNVNVFRVRGWDKFQRQQGSVTLKD